MRFKVYAKGKYQTIKLSNGKYIKFDACKYFSLQDVTRRLESQAKTEHWPGRRSPP